MQYAEPGYLLFVRERTLVAQKFDAKSMTLQGEPVPLGEGLGSDNVGLASFSVSRTGVLVFKGGELGGARVVSVDRTGRETAFMEEPADYRDMSLSPDGTRFVYTLGDGGKLDLWTRDLQRGVSSRFTVDPADEIDPQWSADGRRIFYTSTASGPGDLMMKDASGTREAEPLLVDKNEKYVLRCLTRRAEHRVHVPRKGRQLGCVGDPAQWRSQTLSSRKDNFHRDVGHLLAGRKVHCLSVQPVRTE